MLAYCMARVDKGMNDKTVWPACYNKCIIRRPCMTGKSLCRGKPITKSSPFGESKEEYIGLRAGCSDEKTSQRWIALRADRHYFNPDYALELHDEQLKSNTSGSFTD